MRAWDLGVNVLGLRGFQVWALEFRLYTPLKMEAPKGPHKDYCLLKAFNVCLGECLYTKP